MDPAVALGVPIPVHAAGGVVCRYHLTTWEVAIVGSGDPVVWRLPKGMCELAESLEETALREVREETGLDIVLGPRLGAPTWTYEFEGKRYQKITTFFLMFFGSGDFDRHDSEFSHVAWASLSEAANLLAFQSEKDIINQAVSLLAELNPTIEPTPSQDLQ